ncbi:hypothetical protein BJ978_001529 [Agromyces terreus]|uniref:Uncharacterized protein n=1 Tax=Agromyces terreus TaxID=424795 RepID=A0A9X2KAY7_9MICO|nr:hypothetical protein [Agromyces terreus]MCP2370853.1 hypothetical protein [Agromyces terreus]
MKRTFPALVVAVLGAGLALAGTAAPASAVTDSTSNLVVGTCDALSIDLSGYAVEPGAEAVYTPGEPAVAEVSHTDYQYERWTLGFFTGWHATGETRFTHKWVGDRDIYDWGYYKYTGVSKKHVDVEGKAAVDPVLVTPAVPADAAPNTVTVEIDGATVVDAEAFGADYSEALSLAKGTPGTETYGQHTYSVSVTAYQGFGAEPTTSVVADGTTACATGEFAAAATVDTETTCGTAVVTLTNDELVASKVNGTYSAIVWVDGTMTDILAVFENKDESKSYAFAEDSGDHVVEVRTGPAHGDALLASATVDSNCESDEGPVVPATSLTVSGSLIPGGSINVAGTGFAADTEYEVELHSTPQSIASTTSDADGSFSADGTIATDTPEGEHEIVVLLDGEEVASTPVIIGAAPVDGGDDEGTDGEGTDGGTATDGTDGTGGGTDPGTDDGAAPAGDDAETGSSTTAGTDTAAASDTSSGLAATGFDAFPLAAFAAALLALAGIAFGARRAIRVKG